MEKDGHKIVGYVRKSTQGCPDDDTRKRLIETMILRLKDRSYVSSVCHANRSVIAHWLRMTNQDQHLLKTYNAKAQRKVKYWVFNHCNHSAAPQPLNTKN
ncbi:hypothetical protein DM01DRAFT_1045305 [Hesseltinella vesiculosa]|uniref:Uncharacterized protein n=1 Tax=Hesseltinella vesiculosa TaxID=101127 RepID=A0A1X2GGW7_9FUNG|nr:hypothetical protein DM01DRAFT_1045305 [Hesseltinella vesiculosa]